MGLQSGVLWSPVNIDTSRPGGFADSPFKLKCSFFSWGNTDAHNPNSRNKFDYYWGFVNDNEPYYENQPYGSTPGAELTGDIPLTSDAARVICGGSWRMPSSLEFQELLNGCDFVQADGSTVIDPAVSDKRVTVNGVMGVYLKSKVNGNLLFFPCCGFGSGTGWLDRGSLCRYKTSTFMNMRVDTDFNANATRVVADDHNPRCYGCPIRPVMNTIG